MIRLQPWRFAVMKAAFRRKLAFWPSAWSCLAIYLYIVKYVMMTYVHLICYGHCHIFLWLLTVFSNRAAFVKGPALALSVGKARTLACAHCAAMITMICSALPLNSEWTRTCRLSDIRTANTSVIWCYMSFSVRIVPPDQKNLTKLNNVVNLWVGGHQVEAGLPSQIWRRFWFPTRTRWLAASLRWTATRNFPLPPFKSKLVKQELWAPRAARTSDRKHPRESSNNIDSRVAGAHVAHQRGPHDFKCQKAHY